MLGKKERLDYYNQRIEVLSTDIEMQDKLRVDTNFFAKTGGVVSAIGVVTLASLLNNFTIMNNEQIAICSAVVACGSVLFVSAYKKKLENNNRELDIKISDDLREINVLSNKISLIENQYDEQNDNQIAQTLIENRARIFKKTMNDVKSR